MEFILNFYLTDREELHDMAILDDDCIKKFVCQLLVANFSVPPATQDFRKLRLINLLQEATHLPKMEYDNQERNNNNVMHGQNAALLNSYSIYEWGDLIKLVLG